MKKTSGLPPLQTGLYIAFLIGKGQIDHHAGIASFVAAQRCTALRAGAAGFLVCPPYPSALIFYACRSAFLHIFGSCYLL